MMKTETYSIAAKAESYWRKTEGNSEAQARKVANKFKLRFATSIPVDTDGADAIALAYQRKGKAVLRNVDNGTGVEHLVFHA